MEESKRDYLMRMYKHIEQVWDGCRPVILNYSSMKAPKRFVTIESSIGVESKETEPIEMK